MSDDFLAGFVAGEGCFGFYKVKGKENTWSIHITVDVHDRDIELLHALQKAIGAGTVRQKYKKGHMARWCVTGKTDVATKIIPFFDRHLTGTYKRVQYLDFRARFHAVYPELLELSTGLC